MALLMPGFGCFMNIILNTKYFAFWFQQGESEGSSLVLKKTVGMAMADFDCVANRLQPFVSHLVEGLRKAGKKKVATIFF